MKISYITLAMNPIIKVEQDGQYRAQDHAGNGKCLLHWEAPSAFRRFA